MNNHLLIDSSYGVQLSPNTKMKKIQEEADEKMLAVTNEIINEFGIYFNKQEFTRRSIAIECIKILFGKNKRLVHDKGSKFGRGSSLINLRCDFEDCKFRIICKKGSSKSSFFTYKPEFSFLSHGTGSNESFGICSGKPYITKVSIVRTLDDLT